MNVDLIFWPTFAAILFAVRKQSIFWPLLALALLLLFNHLFTPGFFNLEIRDGRLFGSRIDVLQQSSKVILLALGMALVIGTGGVDLSVGSIMAISGAVMAQISVLHHSSPGMAILAALGVALLAGAWNGLLVAGFGIPPIVATLILMVSGRGIAQLITDGQIINFTDSTLNFLGSGSFLGLPFTLTIVLLMLGVTALLTRKTALGLFIESVGDNDTASRYSGINAKLVKFSVYVFSGFCAGLAGVIYASNISCADSINAGLYLELDAILAVVVGGAALTGGRFYLIGSLIGAILIQTLTTTMYARNVPSDTATIPKAIVILGVCLLQSEKLRRFFSRVFSRKSK